MGHHMYYTSTRKAYDNSASLFMIDVDSRTTVVVPVELQVSVLFVMRDYIIAVMTNDSEMENKDQ
jgi:hypothetical protein